MVGLETGEYGLVRPGWKIYIEIFKNFLLKAFLSNKITENLKEFLGRFLEDFHVRLDLGPRKNVFKNQIVEAFLLKRYFIF